MNKEEALAHFTEHVLQVKRKEMLQAVDLYFDRHQAELVQAFIESFRQLCWQIIQMQRNQLKGKIAYITYSLLRTEMIAGRFCYLMEAFDHRWFFDRQECQAMHDASWAGHFLERLAKELAVSSKRYVARILPPDVDRMMLAEAVYYHRYVQKLAQLALPKAVELPEYQCIEKEEKVEVRVGEYLDRSDIVYQELANPHPLLEKHST